MILNDNDDDDCNVIIINSNNSAKDRASSREEEGVSETTEIAEKVKDAVLQLYFSSGKITKNGKPEKQKNEFTLLAGFVVEEMCEKEFEKTSSTFRCVALGTGTKCIPNAKRRKDGCVLCDSHAEVIARRALVKWMHEEISKASTSTIVAPSQKSAFIRDAQTEMFQLKGNVKLHFFISQPPCGDASVFSAKVKEKEEQEEQEDDDDDKEKERNSTVREEVRGKGLKRRKTGGVTNGQPGVTGAKVVALSDDADDGARYKVDAEFGVSEQETSRCRIKPGRGDLTSSMSCSDKIAKWIMLGFQGTLLSLVLSHPMRMSTITIGLNAGKGDDIERIALSSRRAFIDRVPVSLRDKFLNSEGLPRVIVINLSTDFSEEEQCLQSFSSATRGEERVSCPTSINWFENCEKQEVTVGATGFKAGAPRPPLEASLALSSNLWKKHVSRLSRRALVRDFMEKVLVVVPTTYRATLAKIESYQALKTYAGKQGNYGLHRTMFLNAEAFRDWTKKEDALSRFTIQEI
jgi:hypothetical protein